jgi:hypothetical protein
MLLDAFKGEFLKHFGWKPRQTGKDIKMAKLFLFYKGG